MSETFNRFVAIDVSNPHIWRLFEGKALLLIHSGYRYYSAHGILYYIRLETNGVLADGTPFKINNNWSSYYARKFRLAHPEHAEFFRYRASPADVIPGDPRQGLLFEVPDAALV